MEKVQELSQTRRLALGTVGVWPPIGYHEGTRDSCSDFGVYWNSTVNTETDSRFILVRTLDHDRVIALRPVSVSLLRWIDYVVLSLLQSLDREVYSYCLMFIFLYRSREPCPPLYSLGGKSPSRFTM
jgi:hypothetical protein